jgi:hypothetical protein
MFKFLVAVLAVSVSIVAIACGGAPAVPSAPEVPGAPAVPGAPSGIPGAPSGVPGAPTPPAAP